MKKKDFFKEIALSVLLYRKYSNLVHTQVEIISDPNYLVRILFENNSQSTKFIEHFLLFWKFRRRKSARITIEFVFLVSQKFVTYKILNTLNLFWLTIDSSVLPNDDVGGGGGKGGGGEVSFSFMTSVIFLFVSLIV